MCNITFYCMDNEQQSPLVLIGSRYQLQAQIGVGGMGVVYRALDRLTGQLVALKYVTAESGDIQFASKSDHTDFHLSLAQEFRALAGLRHPNIVSVLDYGFADFGFDQRQPYFTMQLVEGAKSITEYGEDLATGEKVRLLVETLQALAYLHRRGTIHRDMKPANVLVRVDGVVKVMDFGLALYESRSSTDIHKGIVGTMAYMAPELFMDERASITSDLFSMGVIAYELFTGRYPFEGKNAGLLLYNIMNATPDTSMLDARLSTVLQTLMAKNPAERYASAEAAMIALCNATGQPVPDESPLLRESVLQAAKFVGREHELSLLVNALNQMTATGEQTQPPDGCAWLIGGESGVGKTRLLEELRARALVKGAMVLRGQAVEVAGQPYQLWRDPIRRLVLSTPLSLLEAGILKEIVPDISALLEEEIPDAPAIEGSARQQRLILTMLDVFKRQEEPIVLLLEDLQWSMGSLEPLKQLITSLKDLRCLIVGTYRDDERSSLPSELPGMEVIRLSRLPDYAVRELTESMLGQSVGQSELVDLLMRETEGNTFFMVEVMRALAEDAGRLSNISTMTLPRHVMTGGVRQIARRRLSRVPEWAKPLLKLVAVAGREIDLHMMRLLGEEDLEAWLTACLNAAVLEIADGSWRFSHDKLRETLVRDLTEQERPLLHQAVAESLETAYPNDDGYAEALAEHWFAAGDLQKGLRYTVRAVEQRMNISADYARAKALATQGLGIANGYLSSWRPTLLMRLGDIAVKRGDYEEATAHYEAAMMDVHRQTEMEVELLNSLSRVKVRQGYFNEAANYAKLAFTTAKERNDLYGIATSLNSLGNAAFLQGDYNKAQENYTESLSIRREIGDYSGVAGCLNNLGAVADTLGQHEAARNYHEESLEILQRLGDRWATAVGLSSLAVTLLTLGDLESAKVRLREGLRIARNINAPPVTLSLLAGEARLRLLQGEAEKSAELVGLLEAHPSTTGDTKAMWVEPLMEALNTPQLCDAIERGKWLDLDRVVDEILA
jgi:eukaryotic-like serine/threonine-protein kinase